MPKNFLFSLKIIKIFLLNSRENKKSRKIGFTILRFFYHFLWISKAGQKKKREKIEQCWAAFSPDGPSVDRSAPVCTRARWRLCTETPGF
jgi:hypothetical protein